MVANKHISKVIIAVMAVAVILCLLATAFSEKLTEVLGGTGVQMEYENKLFNTDEVIEINISIDEDDWNRMLKSAGTEEYFVCDVEINGKKLKSVAIRPKGNTSLSSIAMDPDTDRFSLKLEFDHFVKGQTCYGLDKLILNNNYADATNMKEAIIYDMFQYIGAESSLYNYAKVSVNGEYWGVYLALEAVEESFMLRNFGTQDGELYKPDSMEMGGGKGGSAKSGSSAFGDKDFPVFDMSDFEGMTPPSEAGGFSFGGEGSGFDPGNMPSFGGDTNGDGSGFDPGSMPSFGGNNDANASDSTENGSDSDGDTKSGRGSRPSRGNGGFDMSRIPGRDSMPDDGNRPDMGDFDPFQMEGGFSMGGFGGMGGFSMGGGGSNLNYNGDDLDNYSTIWNGEITGTGKNDHRRVVEALKNISEGNDIEKYLDVDNVLKYMAVHTFAVNMDSLSGSMAHNYYLYEYDGQLNILPWDYNLSLGGMAMGGDGNATDVVNDAIDTPFSGTKFFDVLLENEEYLAKYHEYLRMLVDEYVNGGRFDEVYSRIRSQIDSLVDEDPSAFFTYDEYVKAADILYQVIELRAKSVEGQLNGTIPSTDEGQRQDTSSLIDASYINVKDMGQMNMGAGGK